MIEGQIIKTNQPNLTMRLFGTFVLIVILGLSLIGCDSNKIYDNYIDLENSIWHEDSLTSFEFEIENNELAHDVLYNVRYAGGYPFYNLFVTYYLEDSASNIIDSELQELILFNRKTGAPLGDGLGDIFDHQEVVFEKYQFPYNGRYTLKVKQFMRQVELPGIMSFGLRIENPEE